MFEISKQQIREMENRLYHLGMVGGMVITPVRLPKGILAQQDVNYLYSNKDIIITIYRLRNENGVWCDTYRIEFENMKTQKGVVFNTWRDRNHE